jgi:hypothetical protein
MKSRTVYLAAPNSVRSTDRYETYYFLISHHFKDDSVLEARELFPTNKGWKDGWSDCLQHIDALVFLRNDEKCVGMGTWQEICEARKAGKQVYLACTDRDDKLVLASWDEVFYRFGNSKQNYVHISTGAGQRIESRWHHEPAIYEH